MSKTGKAVCLLLLFFLISAFIVFAATKITAPKKGVITPLGNTEEKQEITLTADAYYIDSAEAFYEGNAAYIEGSEAEKINKAMSGTYKSVGEEEEVIEYEYLLSPVYIGRSVNEIDKYSLDIDVEGLGEEIYGSPICVIDSKTIGIWSPESGMCWIAKKAEGKIDTALLRELLDKHAVSPEESEELVQPND